MNIITKLAYNALTKTIQAIAPGGASVLVPTMNSAIYMPEALSPTQRGSSNGLAFTNTTITRCYGQRFANMYRITGRVDFSDLPATGSGLLTIRFSTSGKTIDTEFYGSESSNSIGTGIINDASAGRYNLKCNVYMVSTNLEMQLLIAGNTVSSQGFQPVGVPVAMASGDHVEFEFMIPLVEFRL